MEEELLVDCVDGICTITINRPQRRNALSVAISNRLSMLWEHLDSDAQVKAIILTSADCGTFCAGMDLREAAELNTLGSDVLTRLRDPYQRAMRRCQKPIIAAMTGNFIAGGMMLALNADIRIGLAQTVGGISEAQIGRGAPWGVPLAWMLPQAVLSELILCGTPMPVEKLFNHGFINSVEPTPDDVRKKARALAERIKNNAPLSVRAGKRMIQAAMDLGCEAGFAEADRIYKEVYASADAIEGPRAFAEKRPPKWLGR